MNISRRDLLPSCVNGAEVFILRQNVTPSRPHIEGFGLFGGIRGLQHHKKVTHLEQVHEVILCCSLQPEKCIHFPRQVAAEILADFGHQSCKVVAVDDQIGAVTLQEGSGQEGDVVWQNEGQEDF